VSQCHNANHPLDVFVWNLIVKKIAHGVNKNHPRLLPLQRLRKFFRYEPNVEALFERMTRHAAESFCESFGIAIFAASTNFGTPANRIPGGVSPLY
jgi:hypothetical protein